LPPSDNSIAVSSSSSSSSSSGSSSGSSGSSSNKVKIKEFICRDKTNVGPKMYDYTSNNWSHWNSNEKLRENMEVVPGKHSIDSLQKAAIFGTSHIIRKVLQCEA